VSLGKTGWPSPAAATHCVSQRENKQRERKRVCLCAAMHNGISVDKGHTPHCTAYPMYRAGCVPHLGLPEDSVMLAQQWDCLTMPFSERSLSLSCAPPPHTHTDGEAEDLAPTDVWAVSLKFVESAQQTGKT
jgi:hypothetical protein